MFYTPSYSGTWRWRTYVAGGPSEGTGDGADVDVGAAVSFAVDGATAVASAFNAAVLLARRGAEPTRGRRQAVLALAVVSVGVAAQAAFAQALYSAHRFHLDVAPFFATGPWVASRIVLLAGTLLLSMLILRRPR
jgi:hypothetical protein